MTDGNNKRSIIDESANILIRTNNLIIKYFLPYILCRIQNSKNTKPRRFSNIYHRFTMASTSYKN